MWTRELLKTNAKQALRGRYWRSFWICLVLSFVGLGGAGANSGNAAHQAVSTVTDDTTAYDIINSIPDSMLGAILVGMLIGSIAALCWALFVVYPLNVGRCRYFMESRQSLTPVSTVVSTFRRPYGNPIVVQLLTNLKIALGFLLLIVPGIYWEYCYELVPYLLAENPYMSATRAMELSKEMMEGEKWNFFILKLSFFGWLLLCVFTFGIGGFFLGALDAVQQPEAQFHDLALPRGEQRHRLPEGGPLGTLFEPLADQVFVAAEDVGEKQLVAVAVHVQRLVDAGLLPAVGAFAQVHQDLVADAPAGVGGQLDIPRGRKGVHRLDQPDGANGDHVLLRHTAVLVLFGKVDHQTQVVGDEVIARGGIPRHHPGQQGLFLLRCQRRRQAGPAVDVVGGGRGQQKAIKTAKK